MLYFFPGEINDMIIVVVWIYLHEMPPGTDLRIMMLLRSEMQTAVPQPFSVRKQKLQFETGKILLRNS